jgi:radical SAM superfamily enzyme YgiQ (UPF0313 family)
MIIIINPPFADKKSTHYQLFEKHRYPNPALTIFAGIFHSLNIPYLCIDAKLEELRFEDILSKIKKRTVHSQPKIIGITNSNTTLIDDDLNFVRSLKKYHPDMPFVIGGPHVSALPEDTLRRCEEIDVVCKFEGTETILELYDFYTTKKNIKSLVDIKGIAFRDRGNGTIKNNPDRERRRISPYSLYRPRWEDFPKADTYYIFTSIGCPYQCSYCFNVTQKRFGIKSLDVTMDELNYLINHNGMKYFTFADATFGVNRRHTKELLRQMINEGIHEKANWECWTRVDVIDEELVSLMKRAGCKTIALGLESGSEKVLKRAHKRTNIGQIFKAVQLVKDYGILCRCFIIFGHIGETIEDAKKTIDLTVKLNPDEIFVGVMTPWPGTEVYELAVKKEEGFELITKDYKKYDKYFGEAMINRNISLEELDSLRNKLYLRLYLQNRRYKDFVKFVWTNRRPVIRKTKSLLRRKLFKEKTLNVGFR